MTAIDGDLDALAERTRSRASKPRKFQSLAAHDADIRKAMRRDISLPILLDWLRAHRGVDVALNTLRKYVVSAVGRPAYDDYIARNGWQRSPRQPKPSRPSGASNPNQSRPIGLNTDIRPRTLIRTERAKNEANHPA